MADRSITATKTIIVLAAPDPDPVAKSKLTAHSWKHVRSTETDPEEEDFVSTDTYLVIFNEDGTVTTDEGPLKGATYAALTGGILSFNIPKMGKADFTIVKLTDEELEITADLQGSITSSDSEGNETTTYFPITVTMEFVKDVPEPVDYNKITVNGQVYDFSAGSGDMDYWGQYYADQGSDAEEIFLDLYWKGKGVEENNIWIEFDMMVPEGQNRIVPGTYTVGGDLDEFTILKGEFSTVELFEEGNFVDITAGTVKVSVEGTGADAVYTVEMNCALEDNGSLLGTWRGKLGWNDETEE